MRIQNDNDTKRKTGIFFVAVIVAIGGIIYELIIGTASSYLVGDSVLQFSLTIGLFLFGMGIGSVLAPYLKSPPEERFILVESLLSFIGGNSVLLLFTVYAFTEIFYPVLIVLILVLGILIGFEIPMMLRILQHDTEDKSALKLFSNILALDYIGALIASILFPVILLPYLGLLRTSYFVGLLNISIAVILYFSFRKKNQKHNYKLLSIITFSFVTLILGMIYSNKLAWNLDQKIYQDEVIYSEQSEYQKIVITQYQDDIRLYLNGNIQFCSRDEHRYHEPLVHIPMSLARNHTNVLILGGGDGLVARELLKYDDIEQITIVDLDKTVTDLAQSHNSLLKVNENSLNNNKVAVKNMDAFKFLENTQQFYDVIIADLPDPNNESLAKLYSKEFYELVYRNLSDQGIFVTQATSIFFTNKTFWTIGRTMEESGFLINPYQSNVPSFGEWGFQMGTKVMLPVSPSIEVKTKFLDSKTAEKLLVIDSDLEITSEEFEELDISTLYNPIILNLYNSEWDQWN